MKDVLINLQMTLIISLRSVLLDDMELDFAPLQTASDDCRVNAGVCLGQLSQRLSDSAKAQAMYPQNMTGYPSSPSLMPPMTPSLAYSSSRSTQSSATFPFPRTPEPIAEQFANLNLASNVRPPYTERKSSVSSGGSQDLYTHGLIFPSPPGHHVAAPTVGVHRIPDADALSLRRPSSHTLAPEDNMLLLSPSTYSPVSQPSSGGPPGSQDVDRESYVSSVVTESQNGSSANVSRTSSAHQSVTSRDRYGPNDYADSGIRVDGRELSYGAIYDMYQTQTAPDRQTSTSYSQRGPDGNHSTLEHIRYLQENSRPPLASGGLGQTPSRQPLQVRSDSLNAPYARRPVPAMTQFHRPTYPPPRPPSSRHQLQTRPSLSAPILVEQPVPALPVQDHADQISVAPSARPASLRTTISSAPSTTGPLSLPTDKNLLGFCKGAFRLQAGLERKAFSIANRPSGFVGMTSFWRCDKCNFEGPVYNTVNLSDGKKKGKAEKTFDPRVRISEGGGIRYRWAFLARCHVTLKAMVPQDAAPDGSFGSFGCIFCCAEGKTRGWISERTGSASDKNVNASGTPIFGNVNVFMQHLETVHRREEGWPNAEMVGRMKLVLGRVPPADEEGWEVNFVPV